jgi:hypothetical protein
MAASIEFGIIEMSALEDKVFEYYSIHSEGCSGYEGFAMDYFGINQMEMEELVCASNTMEDLSRIISQLIIGKFNAGVSKG